MKIAKINAESTNTTDKEPAFRALKLKNSTLQSAKWTLQRDIVVLRKELPDNEGSKVNKYFGQPANDSSPSEVSAADIGVAIGTTAVGLGLAFL